MDSGCLHSTICPTQFVKEITNTEACLKRGKTGKALKMFSTIDLTCLKIRLKLKQDLLRIRDTVSTNVKLFYISLTEGINFNLKDDKTNYCWL